MSRFDEEPDADPHGECAAEIHRLQAQVEALTAENNWHKNHFANLKIEYDDLYDDHEKMTAELDSYKAELTRIANADLKTWYSENNTPADFMAWAQSRARAAIAKGTA